MSAGTLTFSQDFPAIRSPRECDSVRAAAGILTGKAVTLHQRRALRGMAKSTPSHHFRVLCDAGLIRTTQQGVENLNSVRWDEVNERFPGLLKTVMKFQL